MKNAKEIKRREGNYLGSVAPYGFKIVSENGIRILKEEEKSYEVVCFIRRMKREGKSVKKLQKSFIIKNKSAGRIFKKRENC